MEQDIDKQIDISTLEGVFRAYLLVSGDESLSEKYKPLILEKYNQFSKNMGPPTSEQEKHDAMPTSCDNCPFCLIKLRTKILGPELSEIFRKEVGEEKTKDSRSKGTKTPLTQLVTDLTTGQPFTTVLDGVKYFTYGATASLGIGELQNNCYLDFKIDTSPNELNEIVNVICNTLVALINVGQGGVVWLGIKSNKQKKLVKGFPVTKNDHVKLSVQQKLQNQYLPRMKAHKCVEFVLHPIMGFDQYGNNRKKNSVEIMEIRVSIPNDCYIKQFIPIKTLKYLTWIAGEIKVNSDAHVEIM